MRTEFGVPRTACGCEGCTSNCRHMPGYLIPADLVSRRPVRGGRRLGKWGALEQELQRRARRLSIRRLVAEYADLCNLFNGPDLAHKLQVLRDHCDAIGRDYDSVEKSAYYIFDTSQGTAKIVDDLGQLGAMGFTLVLGAVGDVHTITPIELIASEVIPQL